MKNRRRTIITGVAIGVGLAAMMFSDALFAGMSTLMIESTTDTWMGDAQIHREGFRETARISLTIQQPLKIDSMLAADTLAVASTGRLISPASLQSAMEMKPVTLMGVNNRTESQISMLETATSTGSYLSGDSMEIIIGYKLAEDMDLVMGDIAVITAAMADSGFSSRMFRISGICKFGSDQYDRYTAFVNIQSAGSLLGLTGELHEIAIRFQNPMIAMDPDLPFQTVFSVHGNKAEVWPVLAPQITSMIKMTSVSLGIQAAILFGLVLFGIVNSLFMSVYERMYEFGVMKAVGTSKRAITSMVLLEAFWLGVAGSLIGALIGFGVNHYFAGVGISFGEVDFSGVMFDKPIYTTVDWSRLWIYPVATLIFTTLAGIYPGIHAGNLNPSEAIRKSL
ncbi:MAG: ABC transporter permease [Candidatus Sabulitectum sp.]|nr:ABC transporter permease [Candidatus Sabulitectum sp.]